MRSPGADACAVDRSEAVARAVVAVVLAVGIWLGVYAVGDAVGEEDAAVHQFVFLVAAPVVVLALLLYEVSRPWRWRRHP
ncbi:MAG TPA: hypothetical protein VGW38_17030, partial [Chloroflexota bacterium]|nr:hypothetical protein [Chloroflexota bacterium]